MPKSVALLNLVILLKDPNKLTNALQNNPQLINEQDESGRTLLHCFIETVAKLQLNDLLMQLLLILLAQPQLNFNIQNKDGLTALQLIFKTKNPVWIAEHMLPQILRVAINKKTDFLILKSNKGNTFLHSAAGYYPFNCIPIILKYIPKLDINILSTSGKTPLYIACENNNFAAAKSLLDAGANPLTFGDPQYNLFLYIQKTLKALEKEMSSFDLKRKLPPEELTTNITGFKKLLNHPVIINTMKSYEKAHKTARMMGELKRNNLLFKKLPQDVHKIIFEYTIGSNLSSKEMQSILNKDLYQRRNFIENKIKLLQNKVKDLKLQNNAKNNKILQKQNKILDDIAESLHKNDPHSWSDLENKVNEIREKLSNKKQPEYKNFIDLLDEIKKELSSISKYLTELNEQSSKSPLNRSKWQNSR